MTSPLPLARVPYPHVSIIPEILGGAPFFTSSRVPVHRVWGWFKRGISVEMLVRRYPSLPPAAILSGLAFCFDNRELIDAVTTREEAVWRTVQEADPTAKQPFLPWRKP